MFDDDLELPQSGAIMRYLARKYDLYGSNPKEAALIDMVYDGTVDQRDKLLRVVWTKGDFVRRS